MINASALLADLKPEVTRLEDDLRARCDAEPAVDAPLQARYEAARSRKRTALTYKAWREEELTNVAVAWVLACVFVRFLEDNGLVETPHLAGPDAAGLARARDQHELYFRAHPHLTEREYLEHVFNATAALPGMREFFDRRHNPLWAAGPSGDGARALVEFWRKSDPETGRPRHGFADPEWDTRFLGDLYQDLSEAARKRYALLQTPVFIEEFILDRTLTPAIATFGFRVVRMIDPTCGSGHFLLGGFARLHRLWVEAEPGENPAVRAQRALDQVSGVDLNPNVVAIARFRLLIAALRATGTRRLRDAYDFRINVATGDALLHGRRFVFSESDALGQRTFDTEEVFRDELKHFYEVEDAGALHRILGRPYHAVVGNPPYITVKDRALSELYRGRYPSCSGKYSLSAPFLERFFDLAVKGDGTPQQPAGFVGQITANSFMKREFGKKLIEEYLPRWDLTHVLDTAGAYIPGHGTPTVILLGKNQPPVCSTIRTVLGIRGEPATPDDPAQGLVWQAIVRQIDAPGSVSEWVSAGDSPRASFHRHPWSIGGGGCAELKEELDKARNKLLGDLVSSIGFLAITGEDEAFVQSDATMARFELPSRPFCTGDTVRDWQIDAAQRVIFPYGDASNGWPAIQPSESPVIVRFLWPFRCRLKSRNMFGKTIAEHGFGWFEYIQFIRDRIRANYLITFAFVGTHNHFVLNSAGKVFKQSSPVIKLKPETTREDHTCLLGTLNSSAACFWMKQIFHNKGSTVDEHGARQRTAAFEDFYEHDGTKLRQFPVPAFQPSELPTALVKTSTALQGQSPAATLASWSGPESADLRPWLASARDLATRQRRQLIAWQEELDWQMYEAFGLVEGAAESGPAAVSLPEDAAVDAIPPEGIELGQRAFEIVLARRMAAGEVQTTWFERHKDSGSAPITEIPRHWPAAYRALVERRIRRIEEDANIRLIEQPEYKRRWNTEPWDEQFQRAAREWLLLRLETYFFGSERMTAVARTEGEREKERGGKGERGREGEGAPTVPLPGSLSSYPPATRPVLTTTHQLAEIAKTDAAFLAVAEAKEGAAGFSVAKLVRDLVDGAAVPFLPAQRYKPAGLLKRHDWEAVWDLQREEDRINAEIEKRKSQLTAAAADPAQGEALQAKIENLKSKIPVIPVPPKYTSGDFRKNTWWSLRGKLDVPKERWVSYPGAERGEDPSLVVAWAGWDHAQQAMALAEYFLEAKNTFGLSPEKLKLLLAGLLDLEPWLVQWHSAIDPVVGDSPANSIRAFLDAEAHALGVTRADLEAVRVGK